MSGSSEGGRQAPGRFHSDLGALAAGALGAGLYLVGLAAARGLLGQATLLDLLSDLVSAALPLPVFRALLGLLEFQARPLLLAGLLLTLLALGSLGGLAGDRLRRRSVPTPRRWLWLATAAWLLSLAPLLLALTGPARLSLAGAAAYAASHGLLAGLYGLVTVGVAPPHGALRREPGGRRAVLQALAVLAGGVVLGGGTWVWYGGRRARGPLRAAAIPAEPSPPAGQAAAPTAPAPPRAPLGEAGLPSPITPNPDFYVVSKNFTDPRVGVAGWGLEVGGLVDRSWRFTYEELRQLPSVEQVTTLICISNPVGGELISNAAWRGIPVGELLAMAGVNGAALDVVGHAADGYSDSVSVLEALDPQVLVAWEMNGEPLPVEHGFPARLLIPGLYGLKSVKWLTRLELVSEDYQGYWQVREWSDVARIKIMSRIDVPKPGRLAPGERYRVGGVAFAGRAGIERVEVSTDSGTSWHEAELLQPRWPLSWVLWRWSWVAPQPGRYRLKARATDGRGRLQDPKPRPALPEGATGYHFVTVEVPA